MNDQGGGTTQVPSQSGFEFGAIPVSGLGWTLPGSHVEQFGITPADNRNSWQLPQVIPWQSLCAPAEGKFVWAQMSDEFFIHVHFHLAAIPAGSERAPGDVPVPGWPKAGMWLSHGRWMWLLPVDPMEHRWMTPF